MQKIEIILTGTHEEECAQMINDLAYVAMEYCKVTPLNIYCGVAPVKRGVGELKIPEFLLKRKNAQGE